MNKDFDKLIDKYQQKVKQASAIHAELESILNQMNRLQFSDRENIVKLDAMMKKFTVTNSDILEFNVGGTVFSVCKSNINKKIFIPDVNIFELRLYYDPNLLQGMISGIANIKHDKDGTIFIDRDPKYFSYILNYLRTANTSEKWSQPSKHEDLVEFLKDVEYFQIHGLIDYYQHFGESLILSRKQSLSLVKLCEFSDKDRWYLIYRGIEHGFEAKNFHRKCDGIGKTLTLVRVQSNFDKGHIFGGYTNAIWDSTDQYKLDYNAFIFSLVNASHLPIKMKFNGTNKNSSIYCGANYGPTFGGGYDIFISNDANKNEESYSKLDYSYKHPSYMYGSNEAKTFLAGSFHFKLSEIEVYRKI